ncbi:DUF4172 domain-containing protein [Pararhizobium sp. BT-229]|uniref:DUF4172 domain-containing protein n=1 Tax=Pararhizobium sp. BT-229 TaxID=2986923 RepID=UPI0035581FC9
MIRDWTQKGWPQFTYDAAQTAPYKNRFLSSSGEVFGAVCHFTDEERDLLRIELLTDEAVKTSEIEGEMLDCLSVQSSCRIHFLRRTVAPDPTHFHSWDFVV